MSTTTDNDTVTITISRDDASRVLEAIVLTANSFTTESVRWDGREPGVTGLDLAQHLREKAHALRHVAPQFAFLREEAGA